MSKPLQVGVVGVGYLGRIHAKIYAAMPEVDLVAVVDTDPVVAEQIAGQYECDPYTDPAALVGKVDAVSIVVPTSRHLEVVMPYIQAGTHILMEKPIAPTVSEAEQVVKAANKAGVVFLVGHLERFNAGIMEISRRVDDPRFVEVHRLGTFVERATDVDVITDLMIHDIDIVLSLVDSDIKYLSAVGTPVVTDHVDIANTRLEFVNGAIANVTASRISTRQFRRIRVFDKKSYLGLNYVDQQLDIVTKRAKQKGENFPSLIEEHLEIDPQQPLNAELAHFVDIITHGGEPLITGEAGLRALRVAEQVKTRITESQI